MGVSALGAGLSGLQSYQRALDISANNVANTFSKGFQPQSATLSESSPPGSGVSAGVRSSGLEGTDLATEAVSSLVYKAGFDASAKVITTSDQLLGTLLDTRG